MPQVGIDRLVYHPGRVRVTQTDEVVIGVVLIGEGLACRGITLGQVARGVVDHGLIVQLGQNVDIVIGGEKQPASCAPGNLNWPPK